MNEQNKKDTSKSKFTELFKNLKWYEIMAACWPMLLIQKCDARGLLHQRASQPQGVMAKSGNSKN